MGVKLQSSILGGGGVAATVILEQVQYLGVYVFAHTVYDTGLCLQYIYNIYIYIYRNSHFTRSYKVNDNNPLKSQKKITLDLDQGLSLPFPTLLAPSVATSA